MTIYTCYAADQIKNNSDMERLVDNPFNCLEIFISLETMVFYFLMQGLFICLPGITFSSGDISIFGTDREKRLLSE